MNRTLATAVLAAAGAGVVLTALPAQAGHESNNKADLVGAGVSGSAVVNYAKGAPQEWRSTAHVAGLVPAAAYTFTVNGPAGVQVVCTFTANRQGAGGCTDGETDLGGFGTAQIRDAAGDVVAAGTFERRGGNRA